MTKRKAVVGRYVVRLLVVCAIATLPTFAAAADIEGVRFLERHIVRGTELELKCVGLLRYKVVFKAYVAALYAGAGAAAKDVLADVPKRLELSYFWSIDGDDFGPAGETILEQNFGADTVNRLRPQLDAINKLYEDVEPGDRYALTYIPGVGTELALNGEPKGVVEGAEFAAKYFGIWLGPNPLDASLKQQLMSCSSSS